MNRGKKKTETGEEGGGREAGEKKTNKKTLSYLCPPRPPSHVTPSHYSIHSAYPAIQQLSVVCQKKYTAYFASILNLAGYCIE